MMPLYKTGSLFYKIFMVAAFCTVLLMPQQIEARVLSGSVTERKTNRKIDSMLKAARKNFDSGKVQVALDNYWKILELDPQETFAYLELGEVYVELRIYDRAIELLEPGLIMAQREMDKDTICYYFCILTNAHLALNQTGLANKTLIKAAEASPKNPMPRKILGDIYLANNRIADAIKAYKKAVELDPDYQPAKEKLGEVIAKYGANPQVRPKDRSEIAKKAVPLPAQKPAIGKILPVVAETAGEGDEEDSVEDGADEDGTDEEGADEESDEESGEDVGEDTDEDAGDDSLAADVEPLPLPVVAAKTATPAVTAAPAAVATESAPRPMPTAQTVAPGTSPEPVAQPAIASVSAQVVTDSKPANASAQTASAEEIENQIDKLLAGTPEDKKLATSFFLKLEENGLTEIEELLYDPDPEVRIIGIRTLSEFKAFTPRVKTMLNDALEDPDPEVLSEIQKVLEQL